MRGLSTEELLQKCIQHDDKAWAEFIRRYEKLVFRSVWYKLEKLNTKLPREECHDIVQDIFLSIWKNDKLAGIRKISSVKSWLVLVAVNTTSNHCESKYAKCLEKTISLDLKPIPEMPEVTLEQTLPSTKLGTEEMVTRSETRRALETELAKLRPRQQLALKLNLFDGKTHKDIGEMMNMREKAVTGLIIRAKRNMRPGLVQYLDKNENKMKGSG